ncbi:MAG: acetolactate synthase small subunit, partial [Clostridium sp.]|nr:acetolactate synthase small subunit [Clostridium sp.]
MNRAVLSLLVSNHFGVLTRVTNLFSQRGFNIASLAVGETENENYSRITITTSGDAASVNQIKLQLDKLEDVKIVQEIPDEQLFIREVMLVKVAPRPAQMEAFEKCV